jgi:hypothetical protein
MTKRGIVGIALLVVSLGTIIVSVVSIFVSPILPTSLAELVAILGASLLGVLGILAAFNDTLDLFQKLTAGHQEEERASNYTTLGTHSLCVYPHRSPPYNAVKMIYTGSEIVKDLAVEIIYRDRDGNSQTRTVTEFFPKEDPRMIWHHYKYDFLEPNQVVYFRLLNKKKTFDGKATVVVSFVGASTGKSVEVENEFVLQEF